MTRQTVTTFWTFCGVHKQFGKCVVFLDNASYHKSKAVLEGLEEFGGDIVLEHFPVHA